jgi:hypothetical protein
MQPDAHAIELACAAAPPGDDFVAVLITADEPTPLSPRSAEALRSPRSTTSGGSSDGCESPRGEVAVASEFPIHPALRLVAVPLIQLALIWPAQLWLLLVSFVVVLVMRECSWGLDLQRMSPRPRSLSEFIATLRANGRCSGLKRRIKLVRLAPRRRATVRRRA